MGYSIDQIAEALGMTVQGAGEIEVEGLAEPADATPHQLAMAMKPEYAEQLSKGAARAAVLWDGADWQSLGLDCAILAPRPRYAMASLTEMFDPGQGWEPGIHPSAVIHDSAVLGEGVSVGPFSVIGPQAQIGEGAVIGPQCHIGHASCLGAGTVLREGVKIGPRVRLGARVICQPGAVIGGDGFSFVTAEPSSVETVRQSLGEQGVDSAQSWSRIHSLGGVEIGDDVEIGANSTVDSGTIRPTRLGHRTKLDNLVMIGHNVEVGEDCLLCGQVGIAGSSRIGNNVVLGGQVGVSDNVFIGDNVVAGGATTVLANVPAGRAILGYPAAKMDTTLELFRNLRRLKRLFGDVAELKKTVSKLAPKD